MYNYIGIACGRLTEYEIFTMIVFDGSIRQKRRLFYQIEWNLELKNQYWGYDDVF